MMYYIAFIVVVISYLILKTHLDKKKIQRLEKIISSANLYTHIDEKGKTEINGNFKLNGIFEVHITIDHCDNYVKLLNFVKKHQTTKNMKIIYAASSVKNNQYMISYFTRKDDDSLAVNNAFEIANEMKTDGMKVSRVKVEGHNAQGTPMTKEEYFFVEKYLNKKYNYMNGKPYFEFHAKIATKKDCSLDYVELENFISKYKNVGISYNLCSSDVDKKPLLTIRVFNEGFHDAQAYKDTVMDSMKKNGYIFEDKIQQEFSIYDSYSALDDGWL